MSHQPDLAELARSHGQYPPEAYAVVGEGLRSAARRLGRDQAKGEERHLSARELVEGVLDLVADRFGLMALQVLKMLHLRRSEDVGAITFHLIACGIFGKQPNDRPEDFMDGESFAEAIEQRVRQRLQG